MKTVKLIASLATFLTGGVGLYAGYSYPTPQGFGAFVLALALVLIVDGLACVYGASIAFAGSATVSVLLAIVGLVGWLGGYNLVEWSTIALAIANVILCVAAFRSSTGISEQANPMNLPVFG